MTVVTPSGHAGTAPSALPSGAPGGRIKLSSVRSTKAILGVTANVGGFVAWAVATLVTGEVLTLSQVFIFSTALTAVVAAIAGILLFSSEAQHGTLASVMAAQPARWLRTLTRPKPSPWADARRGRGPTRTSSGLVALVAESQTRSADPRRRDPADDPGRLSGKEARAVLVEFTQAARKRRIGRARVRQVLADPVVEVALPAVEGRRERLVFLGDDE